MRSSNSFHSLIDFSTRVTAKSQTIIDHVYSNLYRYKTIPGIIKSSVTDHYPLFVTLNHTKLNVEQPTFYTRSLKKFNFENFNNDLKFSLDKQLSDLPKLDQNNFDQVFSSFMEVINTTINRHAPLRKLTRRQKRLNKKQWITNGILISIKKKQKLYRTHFLSSNPFNRIINKKYSNMLTRIKAASKKLCFQDATHNSKNSPQKTWEVLNELLVGKKSHSLNHQYWNELN